MKTTLILFFLSLYNILLYATPMHGTGWQDVEFTYSIQKPWNVNVNERYKYIEESNEHHFWIYKDDEPFKQGDTTSPRCEMRIKNDYTFGNHQFEADFYAVEGSDRPCVMQIWLGFMLKISGIEPGGSYWWHQSKELKKEIYGKWIHINIVHITSEKKVYIYMDGEFIASVNANIKSDNVYFKCGVYTTRSSKSEVWIKNIKYYIQSNGSDISSIEAQRNYISIQDNILNINYNDCSYVQVYDCLGKSYLCSYDKEIFLKRKGQYVVYLKMQRDALSDPTYYVKKIINQ